MTDRCVLISSILSSLLLLLGSGSGGGLKGCRQWHHKEGTEDVCCDSCHPGNRIVNKCGPRPVDLCTPCESGTFTAAEVPMKCDRCRQCAGALVFVKNCNGTADTVCGCPAGQRCGDSGCTYCVKGSANANTSPPTTMKTTTPRPMPVAEDNMLSWWLFILFVICCVLLITLMLFIKIIKKLKEKKTKRKEPARITKKSPIIATPTDEPQTLVAVECSFHEPAQVITTESVATEDSEVSEASDGSTEKLIV